jgi:trimethyllysine dioxygenase
MCGAYIGVDEYRSRLAVLTEQFAPEIAEPTDDGISTSNPHERSVWNIAL